MDSTKLLIGDNLTSHMSAEVIELCKENNIKFVCFPPNSTEKLQPLDVGFFGPMKGIMEVPIAAEERCRSIV